MGDARDRAGQDEGADKDALRRQARRVRREGTAEQGKRAIERLVGSAFWGAARRVCLYVSVPGEVPTREWIGQLTAGGGRQVAVPYCHGPVLRLCRIESLGELAPGRFGIPEPRPELRAARTIPVSQVDLFVVPGLAFSRDGARLGNGWGYYDRLLAESAPGAWKVGLAFECQMWDRLPQWEHDVRMDGVVTEAQIYRFAPD